MNNSGKVLELIDLVLTGKITTFSSLKEAIVKSGIKVSKSEIDMMFNLIKRLYWGAFCDLNFDEYTELWKTLVVPDQKYPSLYGDLKKSIILSNLYISLLDIHGYTAFCQKTRRNINSLHRLDRFVENTIKVTAKRYGVIAKRDRGDEVILIGSDPVDVINSTFDVINLFSKKISLVDVEQGEDPFLPPFEISGGIVGGYSTMPLIVSEKGDLQGILINLAARLQSRANSISPNKTKVVVDQNTYHKFVSSNKPKTNFVKNIKFLFNGEIEFKGGKLKVYEIYYGESESYKDFISQHIKNLVEKISQGDWQFGILSTLCDLGAITSNSMPRFSKTIELYHDGELKLVEINNDYLSDAFIGIKYAVVNSRDFYTATTKMKLLMEVLDMVEGFDQVVKDYCKAIFKEYVKVFYEYDKILAQIIGEDYSDFLSQSEAEIFFGFHSYKDAYNRILERINSDPKLLQKRKVALNKAFSNIRSQISFSMYVGKK
ncbi:MAG: hypothetical protein ABDH28_07380 [Brevinematia bacterium]